jgi:mannose-6-phosphate isomerase-like protein (cupin superfamily)
MGIVKKADLPYLGSSFHFEGADREDVNISMYLVEAQPGRGAPLHLHEYDEVIVIQEGCSRLVLADSTREAGPGDIVIIKARTPHGFVNIGPGVLRQTDIHVNSKICQRNLEPTEVSRKAGLPLPADRPFEA